SAPDDRRAPTNRVDPPGVEPGLPACHTGVIPPRPQAPQWNGGESNPDLLFARQAPDRSGSASHSPTVEPRGVEPRCRTCEAQRSPASDPDSDRGGSRTHT